MRRCRFLGTAVSAAALAAFLVRAEGVVDVQPWPAEHHTNAVRLTAIDPVLNVANMSGAAWNPATHTLWVANNSGWFAALIKDGKGGFRMPTNAAGTKAIWSPGGDLEGICQASFDAATVYLLDEDGWIREFDVAQIGVCRETCRWDIRGQCPEADGKGPEGITFVPDQFLRAQKFVDGRGMPCVSSNGMGGLMFVGHQAGGFVHVFDLGRTNGTCRHVGRYATGEKETAGLEFDRTLGRLFIWHNTGKNSMEVAALGSIAEDGTRRLRQIAKYQGPREGNLEGFAIAPMPDGSAWCFVADDDNAYGEALVWYRAYRLK